MLLAAASAMASPAISPYDHGGPEIDADSAPSIVPSEAPIKTQDYFRGERELFGYNPRFMPTSAPAFDARNRPYIRATNPQEVRGDGTTDGFLQMLDADGQWRAWSIVDELRRKFPDWSGTYTTGVRVGETRILFDRGGDGYTVVSVAGTVSGQFLLHLPAGAEHWDVHPIPVPGALRLEPSDTCVDESRPPVIWRESRGSISLYVLTKDARGVLTVPQPVAIAEDGAFLHPYHSGAAFSSVRVGDKTYVTFARSTPEKDAEGKDRPGTPQYVVSYDHETGEVSKPALIGFGYNCYTETPDNHNGSAILADSRGMLHVIIGAHQHHFWHVTAKVAQPETAADWAEPVPLGLRRRYDCGLTYVAAVFDSSDRLHLIGRNMSRGTDLEGNALPPAEMNMEAMIRTLDYLRATRGDDGAWQWEEMGPLLVPFHRSYSIFYHKLSIDRQDRLFLTYYYYADQLSDEEKAAYVAKWPGEFEGGKAPEGKFPVKPHDPVIIMSDDGGDTWRIALTEDFLAGIERPQ